MTRWIMVCAAVLLILAPVACSSATPAPAAALPATPASKPAAAAAGALPSPKPYQTGAPAASPAPVQTAAPVLTTDGRLSYVDDSPLTFGMGGQIAHIYVNELDKVSKGQVLAKLDTTALDQAVKTAEFGVTAADFTYKSATADRKLAEAAVTSAQSDLKIMQANVKSAQIDLDSASNTLNKLSYPYSVTTLTLNVPAAAQAVHDAQMYLNLAKAGLNGASGSPEYALAWDRFSKALDALTLAQGNLLAGTGIDAFAAATAQTQGSSTFSRPVADYWSIMGAQLAVSKAQVSVENAQNTADNTALAIDNARNALAKAQIAEDKAKSDVDRARNDLDKAKFALTLATIVAPFDGVAARVNSKELDPISPGSYSSTIVIEVVEPRHMELDVKVSELDVPRVKVGQKASLRLDALPDQKVSAVVTSVASLPSVDSGVLSYIVKMVFDVPPDSPLKSGMAATADIAIGK